MDERNGKKILIVGGAVLLGFAILNGIYQAGLEAGLRSGGRGDFERWHGSGYGGFPLFPLLLIGGILFFVGSRRGWFNGLNGGPGSGGSGRPGGPPRLFEEWHRRAHEAEGTTVPARVNGATGPASPPAPTERPGDSPPTPASAPPAPAGPSGGLGTPAA